MQTVAFFYKMAEHLLKTVFSQDASFCIILFSGFRITFILKKQKKPVRWKQFFTALNISYSLSLI